MTISRRGFVGGLATVGCASLCSSGCGNDVSPAPYADVTVDDDPSSATYGKIAIVPAQYPQLLQAGGAISLRVAAVPPDPTRTFSVPDKGILLVHRAPSDGTAEYVALRGDCPHQGCPLGYNHAADLVECPCHGSRFRASGTPSSPQCAGLVVHPPAKDNLSVWQVDDDGSGRLFVDLTTVQTCGVSTLPPVVNGLVAFTIGELPALSMIGGSVVGTPKGLADTLIVARVDATTVVTVSDICTHMGCHVSLDLASTRFHCPCHDSSFGYNGSVLNGPATTPVKSYPTTFDGTTVTITTAS